MPAISTLVETFDSIDSGKWANNYGSVSVSGGRGRVLTTPTVYSGWWASNTWTFGVGDYVQARIFVAALASATVECYTEFRITTPTAGGTDIGMQADRITGNFYAENRVAYSDGSRTSVAYSGTSMAWWRIERNASNVLIRTAPEASEGVPGTWTTRRTVTTPAWIVGATNLSLNFAAYRNNGTANNAEIDHLNTPPPGGGRMLAFF